MSVSKEAKGLVHVAELSLVVAPSDIERFRFEEEKRIAQTPNPKDAIEGINFLRARVQKVFAEGYGVDPTLIKEYEDFLDLDQSSTDETNDGQHARRAGNTLVELRNAAMFPDSFNGIESYGSQRRSLARTLFHLGVLATPGLVVVVQDVHPEGHISGPGEAGMDEIISLHRQSPDEVAA